LNWVKGCDTRSYIRVVSTRESRKPSMSLDESKGMNKELPRQCDEMLYSIGKES
jgi:hypothetical protein